MPEPTLEDLRVVLQARADQVVPPPPPFPLLRDRVTVRRHRRRVLAVVAVAAVVLGVLASIGLGRTMRAGPDLPGPAHTGSPTNTAFRLEQGAPPRNAYVVGRTLHVGDSTVALSGLGSGVAQAGATIMVLEGDDRCVDPCDLLRVFQLGPDGLPGPDLVHVRATYLGALDGSGRYAAWEEQHGRQNLLVVRRLDGTEPDRTAMSPGPPWSGETFEMSGITDDGRLIGQRAVGDWVWHFAADEPVRRLVGVPEGMPVRQVFGNRAATYRGFPTGWKVGVIDDRGWTEEADSAATLPVLYDGSPLSTEGAVWSPDGQRVSFVERNALNVYSAIDGVLRQMQLPPGGLGADTYFEDNGHVLARFLPPGEGGEVLVRCDVERRDCELAASPTGPSSSAQFVIAD